jgi:monovalent cation:H+ antiporter-2, CPA2 family
MPTSPLLLIVVVLAASVLTVALCRRLGLPSLLGYLIVGLLLGPHAFALIPDLQQVKAIAEYGVVFLMFSIGLEFSLPQFRAMRRLVLGFGFLQFVAIFAALTGLALIVTQSIGASIFLGSALAMSSTAIGVKLLAERNEMSAIHSRHVIGALLFQDIAVVPLLILLPAFGASGGLSAMEIGWALLKVALFLGLLLGFGQPVLRRWLHLVAQRKNTELFMLNVLLVTLALAWLCHVAGLPHALGAFVAGMLIAETEYKLQVEDDIRPFRDILLGMFFISVGMQLDALFIGAQFAWVALAVVAIVVIKAAFTYFLAWRYDLKNNDATLATALLVPAGEFGFVLLTLGLTIGALSSYHAQIAIASMVVLMLTAPFMPRVAERINKRLKADDFLARSADIFKIAAQSMARENHVLICGYGRSGQYLARLLESEHVTFVALDNDPERIREALGGDNQGNVVFGDCTRREALVAAGVERARALVVSFTDVDAALKIVAVSKSIRADLPIIVRTFDDEHIDRLNAAGATEVVPEVFEGSLMLATHSLLVLGTPLAKVLKRIRSVREERYSLFQGFFRGASDGNEDEGDARVLHTVTLSEGTWACGKPFTEVATKLKERYDAEVTAVRREGERLDLANPNLVFGAGDALVMLGTQSAVSAAELKLTK